MSQSKTPDEIHAKFNEAVGFHTNGDINSAISIYKDILETDPDHSDSLHLMGLGLHQLGDSATGAKLISRAVELNPGDAGYQSNYGIVLKSLGRFNEACLSFEAAIAMDPKFMPAIYNVAEVYCLIGELEKGERAYREAAVLNPGLPDIWTNLGLCLVKRVELDEAEKCLLKALELQGDFTSALYGLGHVRELQGEDGEAVSLFTQAMHFGFDRATSLFRLATISTRQGEPEEAIGYLNQLLSLNQRDASVYNNLALAFQDLNEIEKSWNALQTALEIDPNHVEALGNAAAILNARGEFEKSIEFSERCLSIDPKNVVGYNNLAQSYRSLVRIEDSIEAYQKAIAMGSEKAELHNNLALVLEYAGRIEEMEDHYKQALRIDPEHTTALANYASSLLNFGRMTEAKAHLDKAIILNSTLPGAWNNLARYHYEVGSFKESVRAYRRFLILDPSSPHGWASLAATQVIRDDVTDQEIYDQHLESGRSIEAGVDPYIHVPSDRLRQTGDPIRVGFVSADFKVHSIAYFLEPLLERMDKSSYSIYCYSGVRHKDHVSERFEGLADVWRNVAELPDELLAKQIRADEIDMLIDLSGYTAGNRSKVFSFKPAPVQVTWLGYAHSTGLTCINYRIVDGITDPENVTLNSESLVRLPQSFIVYRPPADSPMVETLPAKEFATITFCSFNNIAKLTDISVELFSRVLNAVPKSSLQLKSHQATDKTVMRKVLKKFAKQGIDESRLHFLPRFPKVGDHLNAYNKVDIALDTYPYNGTTTTCEALWMGVPVVTLKGTRHASRVSASILSNLGLEGFVAESEDAFVGIAVSLANDIDDLERVRSSLRDAFEKSPLRDEAGFATEFCSALDHMWTTFLSENASLTK